jgi:DNA-binding LytR/AlgR family response regulator
MQVVIIEDELPAASRLSKMLTAISGEIDIIDQIDSVESAVRFFNTGKKVDLVFMDIQLADGLSFDIFNQVTLQAPVIFTTAFDQYTLRAFKVNSVDYLLKPIEETELAQAVNKYQALYRKKEPVLQDQLMQLVQEMTTNRYRERLLIKKGQQLGYLKISSMAYCFADGKLCYAVDFDSGKFMLEHNLTQLETQLEPGKFFRVNRQLIVNIEAISKVHTWLGGRLKLELQPGTTTDTIVSRERVQAFKEWLGQ